jgi:hypothetical protein
MSDTDAYAFPSHLFAAGRCTCIACGLDGVRVEDLFDAWVFAAHDAELALGAWGSSRPGQRADAHAVYRAALDREERAAEALASATSMQPAAATPQQ